MLKYVPRYKYIIKMIVYFVSNVLFIFMNERSKCKFIQLRFYGSNKTRRKIKH